MKMWWRFKVGENVNTKLTYKNVRSTRVKDRLCVRGFQMMFEAQRPRGPSRLLKRIHAGRAFKTACPPSGPRCLSVSDGVDGDGAAHRHRVSLLCAQALGQSVQSRSFNAGKSKMVSVCRVLGEVGLSLQVRSIKLQQAEILFQSNRVFGLLSGKRRRFE